MEDGNVQHIDLIHNIIEEMLEIQTRSQKFVTRITAGESLSQSHLVLLFQLKKQGSMKATDIAEFLHVTPGAVTSICDKLESQSYIERTKDPKDRRIVKMILTAKGEQKIKELFSKFPTDEIEKMATTLFQVRQLMSNIM
ncbi:MarR family winged helix-turn-helix transcriptional regulator [Ornithinibacillus scapharcae]|uniref:MarR family winged helix-turn-helix transcriptional regulator n=1 Tax=Ornithinibacillus scapharcae TaxID=1147159 RepID=UPI000225BD64|nr:MarR family transcriptional regulator [Ornithinibacillus scapharcae]